MPHTDSKRANMTLYAAPQDPKTHWVRIVLAEKGIHANIIPINPLKPTKEFKQLNPRGSLPLPTWTEKNLVLYRAHIIAEYLDERFPHPPLLPVYPIARAKSRQMIYKIEKDWYPLLRQVEKQVEAGIKPEAQQLLQGTLSTLEELFAAKPYFLSDEFTLVDCCIAPLLWQLYKSGIINAPTRAMQQYQERLFARPAFQLSLGKIASSELMDSK